MTPGYLGALALTLAVEPPVYALALRRDVGGWRGGLAGLVVNASSHPLAWLVVHPAAASRLPAGAALVVVETFAVVWEVGLLLAWRRRDPALLAGAALVANGLSLGLGALL